MQSSKLFKEFEVRGQRQGQGLGNRGQGQGLANESSRILEDRDFPRGQQHCCQLSTELRSSCAASSTPSSMVAARHICRKQYSQSAPAVGLRSFSTSLVDYAVRSTMVVHKVRRACVQISKTVKILLS